MSEHTYLKRHNPCNFLVILKRGGYTNWPELVNFLHPLPHLFATPWLGVKQANWRTLTTKVYYLPKSTRLKDTLVEPISEVAETLSYSVEKMCCLATLNKGQEMEEMSIDFFDPKRTISYQLLNEGTTMRYPPSRTWY